MWANRSAVDVMVIVLTLVVSLFLVGTGAAVLIVEVRDPTADTDGAVDALGHAMTVILGALLGLLAGKNDRPT